MKNDIKSSLTRSRRLVVATCCCWVAAVAPVAAAQSTSTPTPPSAETKTTKGGLPHAFTQSAQPTPAARELTPRERAVLDRANARWALLSAGKAAEAYAFMSPASREFTTLSAFVDIAARSALKSAVARTALCDTTGLCVVSLVAQSEVNVPRSGKVSMTLPISENWTVDKDDTSWLIFR